MMSTGLLNRWSQVRSLPGALVKLPWKALNSGFIAI
jgi:hypothetical protein